MMTGCCCRLTIALNYYIIGMTKETPSPWISTDPPEFTAIQPGGKLVNDRLLLSVVKAAEMRGYRVRHQQGCSCQREGRAADAAGTAPWLEALVPPAIVRQVWLA